MFVIALLTTTICTHSLRSRPPRWGGGRPSEGDDEAVVGVQEAQGVLQLRVVADVFVQQCDGGPLHQIPAGGHTRLDQSFLVRASFRSSLLLCLPRVTMHSGIKTDFQFLVITSLCDVSHGFKNWRALQGDSLRLHGLK